MLAGRFGMVPPGAVAVHLQLAVDPAELRLVLDPVADQAEDVIGRDARQRDPLGFEIRGPAKTDVAAKFAFQKFSQRHGRIPVLRAGDVRSKTKIPETSPRRKIRRILRAYPISPRFDQRGG
jgi:hypothetical protein